MTFTELLNKHGHTDKETVHHYGRHYDVLFEPMHHANYVVGVPGKIKTLKDVRARFKPVAL